MHLIHSSVKRFPFALSWALLLLTMLLASCQGPGDSNNNPQATTPASLPTLAATAVADLPTATNTTAPTATVPPTNTAIPTVTNTGTPGPSPTASNTPTFTPIPTNTPTSVPQLEPTLATWESYSTDGLPTSTPPTVIPTAVPTFAVGGKTTNILLLGVDDASGEGGAQRTDVIILVSINRETETASMLSLPRDLFVYIPGWRMNRINTAMAHGAAVNYPGGPVVQLTDTILYNFGVPVHYYALIDFKSFVDVVDAIDGVTVPVTCGMTDWRLKSPELDPQDEDNWERFTIEPGFQHMDGDTALWYVRSRQATSDWDRGRRQQQVLRAILNEGVDLGLVTEAPTLYNTYQDKVETDLDIGRLLQLATLAPAIRENGVQHLYVVGKTESWVVPATGAQVQLPIWSGDNMMGETFRRLFEPPALTVATRAPIRVEIVSATENETMVQLAAENLAWYGFLPTISETTLPPQDQTEAVYYGANFKGSYDWLFSWVVDIYQAEIGLDPDTVSDYDYRVIIGNDYDACLNSFYAPQAFLDDGG